MYAETWICPQFAIFRLLRCPWGQSLILFCLFPPPMSLFCYLASNFSYPGVSFPDVYSVLTRKRDKEGFSPIMCQVRLVFYTTIFWGVLRNACVRDEEMDSEKEKNISEGHYSMLSVKSEFRYLLGSWLLSSGSMNDFMLYYCFAVSCPGWSWTPRLNDSLLSASQVAQTACLPLCLSSYPFILLSLAKFSLSGSRLQFLRLKTDSSAFLSYCSYCFKENWMKL